MTFSHSCCTQIPLTFSTQRTYAKKVTNDHAHYLAQIILDPQVQEAINTVDEASFTNVSAQLSIIQNQWQQYGYGLYIIFDKNNHEFLGFAGYHSVNIDELGTVDCFNPDKSDKALELYAFFMPSYWHKGYGSEVVTKLIELASQHLPHTAVIAYVEPKNKASLGFVKKLNFEKVGMVTYNNKPHILYKLDVRKYETY